MWEEWEQVQTLILSFSFSVIVLTHACSRICLHIFATDVGLLCKAHSKMGAIIFGLSVHLHVWSPTDFSFPVFYHSFCLMALPFKFLPANQHPWLICWWYILIFKPGIYCYPNLDLLLGWDSSLYVCMCGTASNPSHMSLLFLHPVVDL